MVTLPISTIFGFLLVLARMSGCFIFLPVPGLKSGPQVARVVLAVGATLALFPMWPAPDPRTGGVQLVAWMLAEAALGITIGLAVAFLTEILVLAAQIAGLQAGYAYASIVDPNTQADSGVLLVFAQLIAGMLFFVMGLDREVLRILARSLVTQPPGTFTLTRPVAEQILNLGTDMFRTGLKLAMPLIALLMLIDISLALLGRLNAQLQLLTLAFPIKMLAALLVLAWIATLFPSIYRSHAELMLGTMGGAVAH
jgi:flagellar biosynthetic protein FliR